MTVRIFPYRAGLRMGNMMWGSTHPMRAGRFPASHPLAPGWEIAQDTKSELGDGPLLRAFRAKEYWASCFPEGDGVTWRPLRDQDDGQCLRDIQEVFGGWDIVEGVSFRRVVSP